MHIYVIAGVVSCLLVVRELNEHNSTRKVFSVLQESSWMRMQGKDTREARYAVGYGRYMYIAISSGRASLEWQPSPDVEYPDIFNYFVATLSPHTQQQLKTYRPQSIQVLHRRLGTATIWPYKSCWQLLWMFHLSSHNTWTGTQVWRRMELSYLYAATVRVWQAACFHIGALLFTLEAITQLKKRTSLPCSWLPPPFQDVPYAEVKDINFKVQGRKDWR